MDYSIKNITGTTDQDIKNLNDNFKYIAMKLFEDTKTTAAVQPTTVETTETIKPLSNEIELADGNITFYATCNIKNTDGSITVKRASYTLKPDGLYNYDGKLILPINGVSVGEATNIYAKFY